MKTLHWVLAMVVILLVAGTACCFVFAGESGEIAGVYLDGELLMTITPKDTAEEYSVSVAGGGNTITVSTEGIWVSSAACPDQTCVRHGVLSGGAPIICLPHRLVIKWLDAETDFDAITGT